MELSYKRGRYLIYSSDILSIPRGQGHHAIALNKPPMHLTFGFTCKTGIDYIQWLE